MRWRAVKRTPEEISEMMEGVLHLRNEVARAKDTLDLAKTENTYEGKHFESLEELALYSEEMNEKSQRVESARRSLEVVEETLEDLKNALRWVIPPGGSVFYDARDGTRYLVKHMRSGGSRKSTVAFYTRDSAEAAKLIKKGEGAR